MRSLVFVILINLSFAQLYAGGNYFQQEVNYKIKVKLDDINHQLIGFIQLEYINNSPVVLDKIAFHLWPNAYKNRNSAFCKQKIRHRDTEFWDSGPHQKGWIDQLDFKIEGQSVKTQALDPNAEQIWLLLDQPLLPGKSLKIETPFRVKIPDNFSRLGKSEQSYQITQWYPKPAVFDHKGWHIMPYLDLGEFYSEFGNFDIELEVPSDYIIAATGQLQNQEEIDFLLQRAKMTSQAISSGLSEYFPIQPNGNKTKILKYKAENVHDFAWFADKRFFVQHKKTTLPSGNRVDCWTMFTSLMQWKNSIDFIERSLQFYSQQVGDYPWPQVTAVESALSAGGGMEYPMITVIGGASSDVELDNVITHEVGHNWFYGILGFNERDHPFLDEGINSYYENRYMMKHYKLTMIEAMLNPLEKITGPANFKKLSYLATARDFTDQYPNQHSDHFTEINYGNDVYNKTAQLFEYAEQYIGQDEFDTLMRSFYAHWKFKHPYPEDLEAHFNDRYPGSFHWLFQGFLNSDEKVDYKICSVKKKDQAYVLKIKNRESIDAPFKLSGIKDGKEVFGEWQKGFKGKGSVTAPCSDCDYFAIDIDKQSFDLYPSNNTIRTSGLFRKTATVHFKMINVLDHPDQTDIGFTPVFGYNLHNGFMPGLFISGPLFPYRKLNAWIMPMIGLKNGQLCGKAKIRYSMFTPGKTIHHINIGLAAKRFSYDNDFEGIPLNYLQIKPFAEIHFNHIPSKSIESKLTFESYFEKNDFINFNPQDTHHISPAQDHINSSTQVIQFSRNHFSVLGDFSGQIRAIYFNQNLAFGLKQEYLRLELELSKSFRFLPKRYFKVRTFFAFYPINSPSSSTAISSRSEPYFYRGSTGLSGQNYLDEFNEEMFVGRSASEGFWSQQIAIRQGGFKLAHGATQRDNLGNSNTFTGAINLSADLPINKVGRFIGAYLDIGHFKNDLVPKQDQSIYSAGIQLKIIPGIVNVYFPVSHSKSIKDLYRSKSNYSYWNEITFSIKFGLTKKNLLHQFTEQ